MINNDEEGHRPPVNMAETQLFLNSTTNNTQGNPASGTGIFKKFIDCANIAWDCVKSPCGIRFFLFSSTMLLVGGYIIHSDEQIKELYSNSKLPGNNNSSTLFNSSFVNASTLSNF